jgi:energy-coupling factor transport system permease protein
MARKDRNVLSVDWIKRELLRTAYATRGGLFAAMDPRAVVVWYLVMSIAPWFTHNITVLIGFFVLGILAVILARVGPLVLGLFTIGLVFEVFYLFIVSLLFGGDMETLIALASLSLKLGAISMFSMAAFVSLDPEKLSDALLWFRAPNLLAFGVSYGYRMLPILVDEFSTVFDGYRLRSAGPARPGILGWRMVIHWVTMAVKCFYPLMLNTAKSVRTTVEALEARGFTYAAENPAGRRIRLGYLQISARDILVLLATLVLLVALFWTGSEYPMHRLGV